MKTATHKLQTKDYHIMAELSCFIRAIFIRAIDTKSNFHYFKENSTKQQTALQIKIAADFKIQLEVQNETD